MTVLFYFELTSCENHYLLVDDKCVHAGVIIGVTAGVLSAAVVALIAVVIALAIKLSKITSKGNNSPYV